MIRSHRVFWILSGSLAVVLALLYIAVSWLILNVLVTPERKRAAETPAELGFTDVRRLPFTSTADEVLLRGWLVPSTGNRVIILVHGLHSHAWDCGQPDLVEAYRQAGFDVLVFDLRAHGDSGGNHAGLGLLEREDVRAAVDLLLDQGFTPGRIGIHGISYGAATALLAAARIKEIAAVIADSAFANIRDVIGGELERQTNFPAGFAEILMPGLRLLTWTFYSLDINEAAPEKVIGQIPPRPVLLIHGTEDSVIPYEQALRLIAAAGPSAEMWPLPGDHTQGVRRVPDCAKVSPTRDAFLKKITGFFERHLSGASTGI